MHRSEFKMDAKIRFTATSTFDEIYKILISTDESERIEAKECTSEIGKSFLETVSALSNEPGLGGGYILLGVARNKSTTGPRYAVKGVEDPDTLQQEIANQCRQCFNIEVRPIIMPFKHQEVIAILVHIPEAEVYEKPIYIKSKGLEKGAFRRIGPTDQKFTAKDLELILWLRHEKAFDQYPEERATVQDFDPAAIKAYRLERQIIKANAAELELNDIDMLKSLEAIITLDGQDYPTTGGLLLFGKEHVLNRLYAFRIQIDYLLIEGTQWVPDSERRYSASIDVCKPLLLGIPYLF